MPTLLAKRCDGEIEAIQTPLKKEKYIFLMIQPQIREQMLVPGLYVFTLKFEIPQQPIKMD